MEPATRSYYDKRGAAMVSALRRRHFDAHYCPTKEEALQKALELIPQESSVGWGGATSAEQVGLLRAIRAGKYTALDRDACPDAPSREAMMRACLGADWFITGANALSLDGQMVNIDGNGNRVAAIIYGPERVLVIAGMNKVCDSLEAAMTRARTVAAPMNQQRFGLPNPCTQTGSCADCLCESSICNQIVITRHCKPAGRITLVLVGEDLGF